MLWHLVIIIDLTNAQGILTIIHHYLVFGTNTSKLHVLILFLLHVILLGGV